MVISVQDSALWRWVGYVDVATPRLDARFAGWTAEAAVPTCTHMRPTLHGLGGGFEGMIRF